MKYFTIRELCYSQTAEREGLVNRPSDYIMVNLERLTDNVLDPLREIWGKPILINSGYRCPRLNKLVGGVSSSKHIFGLAADIRAANKPDNIKLWNILSNPIYHDRLLFDKAIWEYGRDYPRWIHVDIQIVGKPLHRLIYNK